MYNWYYITNSNLTSWIGVESWCDFGANLVQHFVKRYSRYSRYRTKSHDKATISHDILRYSRYQTALPKLQEIIKIFSKRLGYGWAFFYFDYIERTALPCISITPLEPRLTKVKPLSFGLTTVINCFYGFAAVLTVHEEIIKKCSLLFRCFINSSYRRAVQFVKTLPSI